MPGGVFAGIVTGGPAPFGAGDKQAFAGALDRALTRLTRARGMG